MPEQPPLLNLESCLTAGAMFYGSPVRAVRIELADGRVQRLMLPIAPAVTAEDDPADNLTPKQKAILQVVDGMKIGEVYSYEQFAAKSGYSASSDMREFVQSLGAYGRLKRNRLGWERVT